MIIKSSSRYIFINNQSGPTHISVYGSNLHGVGNVRFDTGSQCFQIYDGHTWVTYYDKQVNIELTQEAETILNWAKKKMNEERELEQLSKAHPSLNDLISQIKEKQNQLQVLKRLLTTEANNEPR